MSRIIERGLRPWNALVASDGWDHFFTHISMRITDCEKRALLAIRSSSFHEASGYEYAAEELKRLLTTITENVKHEHKESANDRRNETSRTASGITAGYRT